VNRFFPFVGPGGGGSAVRNLFWISMIPRSDRNTMIAYNDLCEGGSCMKRSGTNTHSWKSSGIPVCGFLSTQWAYTYGGAMGFCNVEQTADEGYIVALHGLSAGDHDAWL
jgi:hypothetical protein